MKHVRVFIVNFSNDWQLHFGYTLDALKAARNTNLRLKINSLIVKNFHRDVTLEQLSNFFPEAKRVVFEILDVSFKK